MPFHKSTRAWEVKGKRAHIECKWNCPEPGLAALSRRACLYHLRGPASKGGQRNLANVTLSSLTQLASEVLDWVFFAGWFVFWFVCFLMFYKSVRGGIYKTFPRKANEELTASALLVCKLLCWTVHWKEKKPAQIWTCGKALSVFHAYKCMVRQESLRLSPEMPL